MKKSNISIFGEFTDRALEREFRLDNWGDYSTTITLSSLLIIIVSFAIDFNKILLFNITNEFATLLILKGVVFFSGILLILFSLTDAVATRAPFMNSVFLFSTLALITGYQIFNYSQISDSVTAVFILCLLVFYTFYNLSLIHICVASILSVAIHLVASSLMLTPDFNEILLTATLLAGALLIGIFCFFKTSLTQRKLYYKRLTELYLKSRLEKHNTEKEKLKELLEAEDQEDKNGKNTQFSTILNQEFHRSMRYGQDLSILVIEMDKVHEIQSNHGDKARKVLLNSFQDICLKEIRPAGDYFSRTQENEFVFILPSTDEYGGFSLAERIREKIKKITFKIGNEKLKISISTGIASLDTERDPYELLDHAESALNDARKRGMDQSVFYSSH